MTLSITNDIRSITELKRDTSDILNQIHETKRPIVLTVNGKAEAVLVDAEEYEKMSSAFNLLKMLIPAEENIKDGNIRQAGEFFKEFKSARKI